MKPPVEKSFKAGTYLFRENDNSRELYIVQSGSVKVLRKIGNRDIDLAVLRKGSVLGEMALIDGNPRSASALANEDCKTVIIDAESFFSNIKGVPNWFMALIRMISQKIRKANDRLQRLHSQNLGINIVISLGYFFDRYGKAAESNPRISVPLNNAKKYLTQLLGATVQRIEHILGFLQENHFIEIDNEKIILNDAAGLDEYSLFLRLYVRKAFGKIGKLSNPTMLVMTNLVKQTPGTIGLQDAKKEWNGDILWAAFSEPELIDKHAEIAKELKDTSVFKFKGEKTSDANPFAGQTILVDCGLFTRYYLCSKFSDKVPSA
jgi:CRP/FNR family transcriptional regulator